jgi:hypothetical protein
MVLLRGSHVYEVNTWLWIFCLVLQLFLLLKHRRPARGAWVLRQRAPGRPGGPASVLLRLMQSHCRHITCIFLSYTVLCHIRLVGEQCFAYVGVSPYALFYCFFDCLKELNVNFTYDRHIPLQINHMSGIIRYYNFSTVTSERIIFLFCKFQYSDAHDLRNGYKH